MKLKMPGDVSGGLLLFVILIGITTIELFFMKKVAYSSRRGGNDTEDCLAAGGRWIGNPEDPCCKDADDSLPEWIGRCTGGRKKTKNEELGCPDDCAFDFRYPRCEKCPQPRGERGRGTSGGFL